MCLWIWLLVLHDCSHQNPDCSVAQVKWISYGESNPSSFAACCVAACVVLFVVLWEEFADSRAGFRCHPSNTLQKTLLPFHWWCQDEVGPAPSGGMFTWRACCCLCRNKPSLMPRRLLLSKEKNKKQHEWLCSVFCPLKAVICVSVSVINACVPLISPEQEQNAKLHFFLAHIRRLMIKFGDKSWFVLCFRSSSLLLTHTPAASSSSHRVARLAFPCVFQAVFLTRTGHSLARRRNSFSGL